MAVSSQQPVFAVRQGKRIALALILAAVAALIAYTVWNAILSAFANDDFPESLAIKVELLPWIFPVHMVSGALALLLLPLAIVLRRRRPWHRWVGRIAAADVLISGLTAFPVAWVAPVTLVSAAGFSAQATTWLVLLALGIRNILRRRIVAHRHCMILMTATTAGAMVFRVFLAVWAMGGPSRWFEAFYALDAWIAWMLPLGLAALALSYAERPRVRIAQS